MSTDHAANSGQQMAVDDYAYMTNVWSKGLKIVAKFTQVIACRAFKLR